MEFIESDVDEFVTNVNLNDENNSVIKTINWFNEKFNKKQRFKVKLSKNIPIGAGLGGGSSNSASTLKFLCKYHGINVDSLDLENICLCLGAEH